MTPGDQIVLRGATSGHAKIGMPRSVLLSAGLICQHVWLITSLVHCAHVCYCCRVQPVPRILVRLSQQSLDQSEENGLKPSTSLRAPIRKGCVLDHRKSSEDHRKIIEWVEFIQRLRGSVLIIPILLQSSSAMPGRHDLFNKLTHDILSNSH